jgi:protein involved in polysaccharide export with SLBB domain
MFLNADRASVLPALRVLSQSSLVFDQIPQLRRPPIKAPRLRTSLLLPEIPNRIANETFPSVLRGIVPTNKNSLRQSPVRRMLLVALSCAGGAGCTVLDTSSPAATQPTALSWLTPWVSQPIEMAPGFDVEEIKPAPARPTVAPQNVLEVTVWDLYEPGKPYSYPVRVSDDFKIDVPMLGQVDVENRTILQVESALVDGFRAGEYLLNPRVIVRSLDAAIIKVQVAGAVSRPGYVELTRADRSVYAAVLSAGGLTKMAGTQVAVTRAASRELPERPGETRGNPPVERAAAHVEDRPLESIEDAASPVEHYETHAPLQRANTVEEFSVSPSPPLVPPSVQSRGLYLVPDYGSTGAAEASSAANDYSGDGRESKVPGQARVTNSRARALPAQGVEASTVWYDVSLARDRDALRATELSEGDMVTVKTATQPLRINGIVNRPGEYPLPIGRRLNVWQAIELAGGVGDEDVPLNITLSRPAAEGRPPRHWPVSVPAYDQHPPASPLVEPGDELHVVPTTGSKIKRVVRNVWSKP